MTLDELALKISERREPTPTYMPIITGHIGLSTVIDGTTPSETANWRYDFATKEWKPRPLNWQRAGELLEEMVAERGLHPVLIAIGQQHMKDKAKPILHLIAIEWLAFDEERKKA